MITEMLQLPNIFDNQKSNNNNRKHFYILTNLQYRLIFIHAYEILLETKKKRIEKSPKSTSLLQSQDINPRYKHL